jgi:type I restriction enzyme S subunit
MKLDTLFENFDLLMDAPNAVPKMRDLILQLAVQGKLVEQDPDDEPASKLLKRIKTEKEKLIAEGKIKKQKPLQPIGGDEIPYELPQSWEWIRLDDVCSYIQRGKGPRYIDNSDFLVVSQKCIQWNGFQIEKARFIDPASLDKYAEERFLQTGDLLWNSTGTGTIGRLCVYNHGDNPYDKVVSDSHVTVVRPLVINSEYLFCFLASPVIQTGFEDRASGTTNQIELATSTVKNQVVALAPVTEQKRIVAKVDQLIQLCDQLDDCQEKASTKYESLNDAALEKLLSSKTIDEFAGHWQFLCNNFDLIYKDPAHVNKLRRAILQLAVQGKLVPQDPNDEPASELLKRIKAKKEKLIAEGKIKKQNPLPPITEDKIPYELPRGWEWVRLGELGEINPRINVDNDEVDVSFIPMKMISEKYGTPHSFDRRKWAEVKKGFTYFMNNDVGLAKITPCFENGKSTVFKGLLNGVGAGTTELHIFRQDPKLILPEYVLIFFKCPKFLNDAKEKMTGTAGQKRVPRDFVRLVPFPLPSISEQKRIVAKVDQLMNLCDELETRLNQSKKDSEMLMQAVLYEAFS